MCAVLEVSRSGYYAWRRREESPRAAANRELLDQIRVVHDESRRTYGAPRVHAQLRREGRSCGRNRVARLMAKGGLRSRVRRRFRPQTTDSDHGFVVAENLLAKRPKGDAPGQIWVADITYIPTDEGWLYLASILDLYSRKVVGWSMKPHMRVELVLDALTMAVKAHRPAPGLVHHSDRGTQYACREYQRALRRHGMTPSMSRRANCYDNAFKESFFHSLKTELVYDEHYRTHEEGRASVFEWITIFYNRRRLHSSLGYKTPQEVEDGAA